MIAALVDTLPLQIVVVCLGRVEEWAVKGAAQRRAAHCGVETKGLGFGRNRANGAMETATAGHAANILGVTKNGASIDRQVKTLGAHES